jgi:hypothetical protein
MNSNQFHEEAAYKRPTLCGFGKECYFEIELSDR